MSTAEDTSRFSSGLRTAFGVVLFVAWGIATVLWVYSAFHFLGEGEPGPVIKAVCALLLMILLAGMEGLEVAVIDRWRELYPDRSTHELAAWLAARQLFVALICTTATLLAEPELIVVPFSSAVIDGGVALKAFTIIWTGLTLLWFKQIFPKHMAATNPDNYLKFTQRSLFPIVEVVRKIGIAQPGEWTAQAVQNRLNWHAEPTLEKAPRRQAASLADAWAALIPDRAPATRRTPDDPAAGA
jgi:putative intracellular protease/amidase